MLSSDDETGVRSASQAVLFCMLFLLIAGIPAFIGMTNSIYLLMEIILGGLFTAVAMRFHRTREHRQRTTPLFVVNNLSAAFVCCINVNQIMTATVVSSNPSTRRKSRAATLALILFPVVIGASMLWLRHVEVQRLASRQIQDYGSIPPFQLTNQDGKPFGSSNLAGKIWIADFIYSTCPGPCPMISSRMSEMQKPLEKTDVHFVSFTVDPEKDTPAQLREYAGRLAAPQPGRWDFLTGPKSEIYKLSLEGFKLAAVDRSSSKPGAAAQHAHDFGRSTWTNPWLL